MNRNETSWKIMIVTDHHWPQFLAHKQLSSSQADACSSTRFWKRVGMIASAWFHLAMGSHWISKEYCTCLDGKACSTSASSLQWTGARESFARIRSPTPDTYKKFRWCFGHCAAVRRQFDTTNRARFALTISASPLACEHAILSESTC